jgi:hypothetical protein
VVSGYQLLVANVSTWQDALFYGFVFTHAVSALVGFGSIGFAGTYAARAYLPSDPYLSTATTADGSPGDGLLPTDDDLARDGGHAPVPGVEPNRTQLTASDSVLEGATVAGSLASAARPQGRQVTAAEVTELVEEDAEVEELRRYFRKPAQLWRAVLLVPLLGLGALATDPSGGGLDQTWVLGALLVWLAATLIAASLVIPGLNQLGSMIVAPAPMTALPANREAERIRFARARALTARGAACCDVLFFVALALMVWRP